MFQTEQSRWQFACSALLCDLRSADTFADPAAHPHMAFVSVLARPTHLHLPGLPACHIGEDIQTAATLFF